MLIWKMRKSFVWLEFNIDHNALMFVVHVIMSPCQQQIPQSWSSISSVSPFLLFLDADVDCHCSMSSTSLILVTIYWGDWQGHFCMTFISANQWSWLTFGMNFFNSMNKQWLFARTQHQLLMGGFDCQSSKKHLIAICCLKASKFPEANAATNCTHHFGAIMQSNLFDLKLA